MFATDDTIVAIATPPGRGALGIVRISGPRTIEIATRVLERREPLEPRHATFTRVRAEAGEGSPAFDEVVATLFAAPHSYTGEDLVEITTHGSPVVLGGVLKSAQDAGARLAEPGEFTLRAFLNGKRDLIQSEAVADLIDAATPLQARVAFDQLEGTLTARIRAIDAELFDLIARLEASLDFPDEGYHFIGRSSATKDIARVLGMTDALLADATRGRMIRDGATVVVVGRPNAGKSSLFNRLLGSDRAIVTPIPGTTRDLVSEVVDIDGLAVTLVDTAGWHHTTDLVESEGIDRGTKAVAVADLVILVMDRSTPLTDEDAILLTNTGQLNRITVLNKSDLPAHIGESTVVGQIAHLSALTGDGVESVRRLIRRALTGEERLRDGAAVSNRRHITLLEECRVLFQSALDACGTQNLPEEFLLTDLQSARLRLDEIVGRRTTEDTLRHIFSRFCIGK